MKCIVKDCQNHSDEGNFVGDLCSPCFNFLTKEEGEYSQVFRNTVLKEREAIYDEWWSCVMSDLENGVKSLNEKAAIDWHKNYPAQSKMFPEWIEARSNT